MISEARSRHAMMSHERLFTHMSRLTGVPPPWEQKIEQELYDAVVQRRYREEQENKARQERILQYEQARAQQALNKHAAIQKRNQQHAMAHAAAQQAANAPPQRALPEHPPQQPAPRLEQRAPSRAKKPSVSFAPTETEERVPPPRRTLQESTPEEVQSQGRRTVEPKNGGPRDNDAPRPEPTEGDQQSGA